MEMLIRRMQIKHLLLIVSCRLAELNTSADITAQVGNENLPFVIFHFQFSSSSASRCHVLLTNLRDVLDIFRMHSRHRAQLTTNLISKLNVIKNMRTTIEKISSNKNKM